MRKNPTFLYSVICLLLLHVPFISQAQSGAEEAPDFILFFGRFHPLILHLPIGFLLLSFLLYFFSKLKRFTDLRPAVGFSPFLGMASACITALFGYFLSLEGGYGQDTLSIHQWLGYGTAFFSIVVYVLYLKFPEERLGKKVYSALFSVLMIVMLGTGHYGGELTHGEDYITHYLPDGVRSTFGMKVKSTKVKVIENLDEAIVFDDLILPIFEEKCMSCHNSSKNKGELILETKEDILKGGESGEIFTSGDLENSILIKNINLPEEDEEHMPPEGKKQLQKREKELLAWWVESGASFENKVAQTEASESMKELLDKLREELSKEKNPVYSLTMEVISKDKLSLLKEKGISAFYIAQNSPLIQVKIDSLSEPVAVLLNNVKEQTAWIDLSNSNCSNEALQGIGTLKNITRLHLQNTNITDEAMNSLSELKYLEYLNLYGNNISNKSIESLMEMEHLRSLYLWKTKVTSEGVKKLKNKYPDLTIDLGEEYPSTDTTTINGTLQEATSSLF